MTVGILGLIMITVFISVTILLSVIGLMKLLPIITIIGGITMIYCICKKLDWKQNKFRTLTWKTVGVLFWRRKHGILWKERLGKYKNLIENCKYEWTNEDAQLVRVGDRKDSTSCLYLININGGAHLYWLTLSFLFLTRKTSYIMG